MDINLLVAQLLIAIYASAIVVPTVQKIKVWFPAKYVEFLSSLTAVLIGYLVAMYYAKLDFVASAWVAFFTLVGAEAIYMMLKDKLKSYTEKKEDVVITIPVTVPAESEKDNGLG